MAADRARRHHHRWHRRRRDQGVCHRANQQARTALNTRPMHRARRSRDERGAMSIEFLLINSAFMLVFLVMLQYAVKAHAHRVAEAAAEEALAAASAYDGSAASGESAGNHYLADLGTLSDTKVTATRSGVTAAVTVSGK